MGTTVRVTSRSQVSGDYRIVGVIAFPTVGEPTAVATGVSFTSAGGDRLLLGDPSGGDDVGAFYVVVRWAAGVDHDEALEQRGIVVTPGAIDVLATRASAPPEVNGLDDVQRFPMFAGAALVVLGLIASSHALLVTVRRRRSELGTLSALGFSPGQRRVVILGQATTIAAVALVLGVPIGAVLGQVTWSAIAGSIGLATDAKLPLALVAAGALGVRGGPRRHRRLPGPLGPSPPRRRVAPIGVAVRAR